MEKYDHLEIRCPRLGGEVSFAYCRKESGNLPCPRTITCWHIYFPVEEHLRSNLSPEEWTICFDKPPKDKMSSLLEIVEAAKKRKTPTD